MTWRKPRSCRAEHRPLADGAGSTHRTALGTPVHSVSAPHSPLPHPSLGGRTPCLRTRPPTTCDHRQLPTPGLPRPGPGQLLRSVSRRLRGSTLLRTAFHCARRAPVLAHRRARLTPFGARRVAGGDPYPPATWCAVRVSPATAGAISQIAWLVNSGLPAAAVGPTRAGQSLDATRGPDVGQRDLVSPSGSAADSSGDRPAGRPPREPGGRWGLWPASRPATAARAGRRRR